MNLTSMGNTLRDDDLSEIDVKETDDYINTNADRRRYAGKEEKAVTGHIWLGKFSAENKIQIMENISYIDEGKDNEVIRSNN